jgi:hypothetical protein
MIISLATYLSLSGGTPLPLSDNKFNLNYKSDINYDYKNTHILLYYS